MGNSKSTLAHEQAILDAAIQEFTANSSKGFQPEEVDEDIQDAMLAVMDGDEDEEEVLYRITKYQEQRYSGSKNKKIVRNSIRGIGATALLTAPKRSTKTASATSDKSVTSDKSISSVEN